MAFTVMAFVVCSADLIMETFSRPKIYPKLITSQYCYYPYVATYMNNIYILVETFALIMVFLEILVAYGVVNLDNFITFNPYTEIPTFVVNRESNIFNIALLDYTVGFNNEQFVGWAYISWSMIRFVGIARRQRQRWIRKIMRLDDEGREVRGDKERSDSSIPQITNNLLLDASSNADNREQDKREFEGG